ncbi:GntR family transcriptional regulator [Hydrocarboniphaga sp.]|uniref:GntR family transcriptional regulator n=1 Tax=Hydrocarboniphaga sp. TaxID=2033016 RepID=UPI00261DBF06|nr:GntR family transcriptional regulator [Hydrocarboniphaga sp.]
MRTIVRSAEDGALLGSEEALTAMLGVSRITVRQVSRLLEREGLLRVRRGINGGYFAARPDMHSIATTVSTYLEMVDANVGDTFVIASVLWVEVVRKAAATKSKEAKALAKKFREKVNLLKPGVPFADVLRIEQESRTAIFALIQSRYIELIFHINTAFAQRRFTSRSETKDGTAEHREFVLAWRNAKLMELDAIADGDEELGMMAARHIRNLWHRRLWDQNDG